MRKSYNQLVLLCFLLLMKSKSNTVTLHHPQNSLGIHCARRCANRVTKVAPAHKYLPSNCLVKCHHPYTPICWAMHLSSPQYARKCVHKLCKDQTLALLQRMFSQPLSCSYSSLTNPVGSTLPSLLYTNVFVWHFALKFILGWSRSCKYFAVQTLQVIPGFSC